jgi:hypothetical protein
MAFDAGSVVGRVDLKTGDFTMNSDKVIGKTHSMTKSMFTAQAAWASFQKVLNFVTGTLKDSVKLWTDHEAVVAQTEAVIKSTGGAAGLTAKQIGDLASGFSRATTYVNDTVQSAENLLLTFTSIGGSVIPDATQIVLDMSTALGQDLKSSAIQVGKALQDPVLGVSALRRVGVNFNQAQQDVIKNLVDTGRAAEAQAMIMRELQSEFGGSAAAVRNTFGGALKALKNQVDDTKKAFGAYIAAAGKPFVENLIQGAKGIEDWLKSAQGLEVISDIVGGVAAAFEVIRQIVEPIINAVWPELVKIGKEIELQFTKIFGKGQEAAGIFTILAGVSKVVALALTVVAKVIQFTIMSIGDFINAIKLSIQGVRALIDAISHMGDPRYAVKALEAANSAAEAWKMLIVHQALGIQDIARTAVYGVKDIIETSEASGKQMAINVTAAFQKTKTGIVKSMTEVSREVPEQYRKISETIAQQTENDRKLLEQWTEIQKAIGESDLETKLRQIREQGDAYKKAGADKAAVDKWVASESAKAAKDTKTAWQQAFDEVSGTINDVASLVSSTWGQVSDIWNQAIDNQQVALDNDYQTRKAYIEANVTDEQDRTTQLETLEAEYNKKKAEISKQQFYAQQASAVANVVFATGQAIMQSFAQWGWPLGLIGAGLATALGAVQIGLILSQQPPAFAAAQGGDLPRDAWTMVGERGKELAYLPRNTHVFTNAETEGILSGGGLGRQASVIFNGDINQDVDIDRAAAHMAAELDRALRSAA